MLYKDTFFDFRYVVNNYFIDLRVVSLFVAYFAFYILVFWDYKKRKISIENKNVKIAKKIIKNKL
jgi:hypothetical protein